MGTYPIDCPMCGKPFIWWSGNMDQRCFDCQKDGVTVSKDDRDVGLWVGDKVFAIETIEGCITEGAVYTIEGFRSEEGRLVITDDRGLEGWYKISRFLKINKGEDK